MSSGDQRMDTDADEPELQRNCKEESARSEIPNLSISDPAGDSFANEKDLSPITPELVQALYSEDVTIQLKAAQKIRKLFSDRLHLRIEQVIKSGAVPRFVHFLEDSRYPELQFESSWVLTDIASGNSAQTQVVIDAGAVAVLSRLLLSSPNEKVLEHSIWALGNIATGNTEQMQAAGAVPVLIKLLTTSSNENVVEKSVWALGNIADASTESRDLVLNSKVLPPLLGLINDNSSLAMRRTVTVTLRYLCDKKPPPNFEQLSQCLPLLARLIVNEDAQILENVCCALSGLCMGANEQIQVVIESGVCSRAVQLLSHSSTDVVKAALFLVGDIARGNDSQTQVLVHLNAVPALGSRLSHEEASIVKNACWALSNITAGTEQQIQAVIDANILPSLSELLHHASFSVRKEAAWAIRNATANASDEQIACLVDAGVIAPFCQLLTETDSDLIDVLLVGLERILRTGESFAKTAGSTVNPYATMVKQFDGLEKMTLLSSHNDPKIKEKASTIIEMYLSTALVK